mmetsp:Transcript_15180/g.43481  ORF Transcript_15180/g.43481 Transcript_15180/m.43481 type:complete len:88 (-) Transcript_15180:373-636(-)
MLFLSCVCGSHLESDRWVSDLLVVLCVCVCSSKSDFRFLFVWKDFWLRQPAQQTNEESHTHVLSVQHAGRLWTSVSRARPPTHQYAR